MRSFSDRYHEGEHEQVWMELAAVAAESLADQDREDAEEVARETMRRVRQNIEVLIPRLEAAGYEFGAGFLDQFDEAERQTVRQSAPVFGPPLATAALQINELESQVGAFPLSLRAFYTEVGAVNLAGGFLTPMRCGGRPAAEEVSSLVPFSSQLPRGLDPLFVYSLSMQIDMWRDWQTRRVTQGKPTVPYDLPIGPDCHDKYGMSGAGVYSIEIPSLTADAPLEIEWHHSTFVSYLRTCFRWGGLPGLELAHHPPRELLAFLTEALLPV